MYSYHNSIRIWIKRVAQRYAVFGRHLYRSLEQREILKRYIQQRVRLDVDRHDLDQRYLQQRELDDHYTHQQALLDTARYDLDQQYDDDMPEQTLTGERKAQFEKYLNAVDTMRSEQWDVVHLRNETRGDVVEVIADAISDRIEGMGLESGSDSDVKGVGGSER